MMRNSRIENDQITFYFILNLFNSVKFSKKGLLLLNNLNIERALAKGANNYLLLVIKRVKSSQKDEKI